MIHSLVHLAAAANYNCDTYGQSAYNECTISTTPPTPPPNVGFLPNTGYEIIIPAALALAMLIASTILIAKKLLRRR
ncbi:MAG TPA: hypothetical protein VD907_04230 [Verrucomicrobiae bacterium]|nr:hypothetical protein [Verrucomicrobiae bacterium]